MTIVIPGMVTISLLSLFYCSMLPETGRKARMQAFERQYIAHRGFHDNRSECPENSLPAFERAIQMGYGIELDVQLTKDGVPVVFHDWDLKRAAGVDRKIRDCTFEELQSYRLFGSSQTIPAFEAVLELADGRTPLIIELKAEIVHRELCEKCAALGILISILAGTPVGSTIVAVDILAFLICSALGRARGGEAG